MSTATPTPPTPRRSLICRLLAVAGWVCLLGSLGTWALLRVSDRWTVATVLMFAPLHLFVLLPAALLLVAVVLYRRALRTLIPAILVTAGPVAGFCVPWRPLVSDPPASQPLRVLTCNMHYAKLAPGLLDRLIDEAGPEIVVLQEWRESNQSEVLAERGWHVHREPAQFLASRHPIRQVERLGTHSIDKHGSICRYELETPAGVVNLFSVHLASPRGGLGEVAKGDKDGLEGLGANSELRRIQSRYLAAQAARARGPVVLVGDFNTPPHSVLFRDVWGEYTDAFAAAGWGWGHTFFARLSAVRIDYILIGGRGAASKCWVGPNVGSPHRPVLADVSWPTDAFPR